MSEPLPEWHCLCSACGKSVPTRLAVGVGDGGMSICPDCHAAGKRPKCNPAARGKGYPGPPDMADMIPEASRR